jgi:hypothetical protein
VIKKFKAWIGSFANSELSPRDKFNYALASLATALQDKDKDGLPDSFKGIVRDVGSAVSALELIMPSLPFGRKRGIERLLEFKRNFTKISANYERDWRVVGPIIEAAVAFLNRASK